MTTIYQEVDSNEDKWYSLRQPRRRVSLPPRRNSIQNPQSSPSAAVNAVADLNKPSSHSLAQIPENPKKNVNSKKPTDPKNNKLKKKYLITPWGQWAMSSQIYLQLGAFLVFFIACFWGFTFYIMEYYYLKDIHKHFREEIQDVHNNRTTNMTLAVSYRIEAYESLARSTALLLGQTYLMTSQYMHSLTVKNNSRRPQKQDWDRSNDIIEQCFGNVDQSQQKIFEATSPVWATQTQIKLGQFENLKIHRIVMMVEGKGACIYQQVYDNSFLQKEDLLNKYSQLDSLDFINEFFVQAPAQNTSYVSQVRKQKMFRVDTDWQFSSWIKTQDDPPVAICLQFLTQDYKKALPSFIRMLDTPFFALAEVQNSSQSNSIWSTAVSQYYPSMNENLIYLEIDEQFSKDFNLTLWSQISQNPSLHLDKFHQAPIEDHPQLSSFNFKPEETTNEFLVVQGCIPLELSVKECQTPAMMLTLTQPMFLNSTYFKRANDMVIYPDIQAFYAALFMIFVLVAIGLVITVKHIVKKMITAPMKKLQQKISTNDLANNSGQKAAKIFAEKFKQKVYSQKIGAVGSPRNMDYSYKYQDTANLGMSALKGKDANKSFVKQRSSLAYNKDHDTSQLMGSQPDLIQNSNRSITNNNRPMEVLKKSTLTREYQPQNPAMSYVGKDGKSKKGGKKCCAAFCNFITCRWFSNSGEKINEINQLQQTMLMLFQQQRATAGQTSSVNDQKLKLNKEEQCQTMQKTLNEM